MTELSLPLRGPSGEPVDLARTVNSHGFAELSPARLDEGAGTIDVTLRVRGAAPRRVRIGPGARGSASLHVAGPRLGARAREDVLAGVRHVLRLDDDLSVFYEAVRLDPDLAWAASGAGRMIQSPTAFEDVIKTVCTTNCAWGATVRMVNALVSELGEPVARSSDSLTNAFPGPAAMSEAPEDFYRDVVRAGYRGPYLIGLARLVASGEVDLQEMATASPDELPDEELEHQLLGLPGVGPYAAAHIMMTMGRNSRLILDSWTRPTYARLLGRSRPASDAAIRRRFRRYGEHAGLAFWLFVTRDWVE
jgi:3-methyladenine DNA glycosylase/8-oxoguanine DNA glycosylase